MPDLFHSADDLGEYLFRIVDNGGETADRYTVLFSDGDALCLSSNPAAPWGGVSLWAEGMDPATLESWVEEGEAVDLGWDDLPEAIRGHVLARLNQAWRDCLADMLSGVLAIPEGREHVDTFCDGCTAGEGIYRHGGRFFVHMGGPSIEDDRGPFDTIREALLASLPDHYGLAGPEYHSTATSGAREAGKPCPEVARQVAALEARREAEWRREVAERYGDG